MEGRQGRLALVGAKGMLAWAVAAQAPPTVEMVGLDLPEFDLTDEAGVRRVLGEMEPEVIVNCAAYTDVDGCETHEELAEAVNGRGVGILARSARETGATLVHLSTDYVFDGTKTCPYEEADRPSPLSAYGRSKLLGENALLESGLDRYFLIRTSWLYGPHGKNFVETIARLAAEREELRVVADQVGSPTYTRDLATAIFTLLDAGAPSGIYHFSNQGSCTWHEFAVAIVEGLRARGEALRVKQVVGIPTQAYPLPAPRPAYSLLSKERYRTATGAEIPGWRQSLSRYLDERNPWPATEHPQDLPKEKL